ncbi:hypothetical protein [Caballeronia calidae]|uniref:hypothetical protein n=1 Tax=Caballeronia calidae TaxID=1777139 RepID=UPI0012FD0AFE|nr:hypothetical protein [Caballeronia calidae]
MHKLLGYLSVSAIQIASLHPGDLLVAQLPEHANQDLAVQIRDLVKDRLPFTANCAVMIGDDIRFDVVRLVNPADRPLQRPIG